jgi:hypothetical protein
MLSDSHFHQRLKDYDESTNTDDVNAADNDEYLRYLEMTDGFDVVDENS